MTFRSVDGLVFGIIVIISGITTVFMDQACTSIAPPRFVKLTLFRFADWQRAVASRGSTAVKAYLLGGLSFMSVPWAFSTACALALVALAASPNSPVDWIANPGLVAPAAAVALMGASGATLLLIVLFLAVTSAASAELVAVASVIVYDIYLPYINPKATEKQVLMVSTTNFSGFSGMTMLQQFLGGHVIPASPRAERRDTHVLTLGFSGHSRSCCGIRMFHGNYRYCVLRDWCVLSTRYRIRYGCECPVLTASTSMNRNQPRLALRAHRSDVLLRCCTRRVLHPNLIRQQEVRTLRRAQNLRRVTLTCSHARSGCIFAAVFSFCCSIAAWLVTAKMYYGVVDVASTGGSYPQL